MSNRWKLATIGIGIMGATALSTAFTTAYVLHPSTPADSVDTKVAAPVVRHAVATQPARRDVTATPLPMARPVAPPRVTPVSSQVPAAPADCATGTDRALRIAKPGLVGTLLGVGLGAAGGAVADGGKGAGKGAIIGGLAGAALGTGYGAYKTKNDCGTIFGNGAAQTSSPVADVSNLTPAPRGDDAGGQLTIYNVR